VPASGIGQVVTFFEKTLKKVAISPNPLWQALGLNKMSHKSLEDNILSQFLAIDMCIEIDLFLPALILIYSGIDALASLNLPIGRERVKQSDFCSFCENYLLPESSLECSAIDLYGARCSTLHKGTAVSDLSEGKKASELLYYIGDISDRQTEYASVIDEKYPRKTHFVDIDELRKSFNKSYFSFVEYIESDRIKRETVYERARYYFVNSAPI
jgi:hypothetical protein